MEGSNSWALFRTMSFISSRARAFKERFSHRQRSFSDSWMDQTSLDYTHIDDPTGPPAFEGGGSMQSLLEDNAEWGGPTIVVQRSKSLESVSTYHRPSIATIYSPAAPLQCTQSSVSIAVTLNSRRPSTIMQKVPLPKPKESLNVPSCEFIPQFFSTPLLQSPATGDADTDLLMSGIPDVNSSCDEVQTSARSSFQELKPKTTRMHPKMTPILSRSRPCVPKSIHSTSCMQISDSQIPKIPGPPPTPKKLRPVSACSLDLGAFQPPTLLQFAGDTTENIENTKPLIDMSSPPQRRKSRPFSYASFDPLIGIDVPIQVQQTSSIPNLTNEAHVYPSKTSVTKAQPLSPKASKPSSTRSLNPFTRSNYELEINTQSTSIPNLINKREDKSESHDTSGSAPFFLSPEKPPIVRLSVTPEGTSDQSNDVPVKLPYRKKMSISSSNLTLPLDSRKPPAPFDPEEWRKYVEATFSSIQETGECSLKSEKIVERTLSTKEKIRDKTLPQVLKSQRYYTKLKHQTSVDESRHHRVDQSLNTDPNARLQEKRKIFFLRKQNNSAPEPVDEYEDISKPPPQEKQSHSVNLCIGRCRARGSDSSILLPTISKFQLLVEC